MNIDVISYLEESLHLEREEIVKFISSSPYRYKVYKIPKRRGRGTRTIAHPSRELKYIQRLVAKKYFDKLRVHSAATAYRKGANIKEHARRHKGAKYLLKMDFRDFFPSIRPPDLIERLEKAHAAEVDEINRAALASLFFYRPSRKTKTLRLSIGAPTSPAISNAVMFEFDEEISTYTSSNQIVYSRYADDLAFSSNCAGLLRDTEQKVMSIVKQMRQPRLKINSDKTVHLSAKHNMHLTGLVLTSSGGVSIGRRKKREIRSLVNRFLCNTLPNDMLPYLRGYLAYCVGVEPEFVASLKRKYGNVEVEDIVTTNKMEIGEQ